MKSPYFSLKNLAFQTPGAPIEHQLNLTAAMDELRKYALHGGQWDAAMLALEYLEDTRPELQRFCDEMRVSFLCDDADGDNTKIRLARRAYNRMVDRLNGQPL
ncbi:hypothetical protein CBA19CS22_39560 [Caballeronia novacaledonica]|uniref:Uncharacterized protein n=1 Tax=Caballeronia novacaledonica TaxID=1544861 RepID=A0ACB5R5U3_9BURK|nr:hypothetical protein CBA19CS22_39560 [Caballeronia novacaledonica]